MMCLRFCSARSLRSLRSSAKAKCAPAVVSSATPAAKAARQDTRSMIAPVCRHHADTHARREVWSRYVMVRRRIDDGLAISTGARTAEACEGEQVASEDARGTADSRHACPKNANDHERNGARTSGVTKFSSRSSQRRYPCGRAIVTLIMWEV